MFSAGATKSGGLSPMAELKGKLEQCVQGPRAKTLTEAMYTSTVDLARLVVLLASAPFVRVLIQFQGVGPARREHEDRAFRREPAFLVHSGLRERPPGRYIYNRPGH